MKASYKISIFLVFFIALVMPSLASSSDLTLLNSTIGLTSGCSDYKLNYSGTLINWMYDIATLQVSQIKEVSGSLYRMNISWRINQTLNFTNANCTTIPNGTNSSYEICNPFNYSIWNWIFEPIWLANLSNGSITNAAYTSNLNAHGGSVYQQTNKDSYIIVRFCGDYLYNKITLNVAIDTIPKLMGTEYPNYTWWNASYTYRKAITVNTASAKTNYPIAINISANSGGCESHCRSDFADIIFVNASENEEIPYYCEKNVSSSWIYCWLSDNWTSNNGTQAYMYYGNNSVTSSHSNGKNTFFIYDDFDDASVNSTIWNTTGTVTEQSGVINVTGTGSWSGVTTYNEYGTSVCAIASVNYPATDSNVGYGFMNNNIVVPLQIIQYSYPDSNKINSRNHVSATVNYTWGSQTGYQRYSICRNGTSSTDYSVNFTPTQALTTQVSSLNLAARLSSLNYKIYADYWFIRNYSFPEPDTSTLGSEQTNATNSSWARLYLNGTENNASYVYGNSTNATATINVTGFWIVILRNGTVIANGTNSVININLTGVGYWNFTAYGQGNSTYPQNSTTYWINITKSPNPLYLTNNYSWAFNYPNATNITGNGCNAQITCTLYMNGSSISNPNTVKYGVANYNFTYYTAGNANYSNNTSTSWLNISQAVTTCTMAAMTSPISYGTNNNATCTFNNYDTGASLHLYRNGTLKDTENNTLLLLPVNYHAYACNATSTENYTNCTYNPYVNVTQSTPTLTVSFNSSDTVAAGTIVNISCIYPSWLPSITLYNDTYSISNPFILNTTGLNGNYNYTCNNSGTANYTSGSNNKTLTVAAGGGSGLSVYIYNEENFTQPLTFNITVNNGTTSNTAYNQTNPYTNNSITGLITIDISSGGYGSRTFYTSLPPDNVTIINASLLPTGSGTWVLFYVYTTSEQSITAAFANAERLIPPSSWLTVAQKKTDASGVAAIFLSPTTTYRLNFSASGYINQSNQLQPAASPYVIYLIASGGVSMSYDTLMKNISLQVYPEDAGLVLNQTYPFFYYINSSDNMLDFFGWRLTYSNGTIMTTTNSTITGGGNTTFSFDTNAWWNASLRNNTINLLYWFKKTNKTLFEETLIYRVYNVSYTNTSIMALVNDVQTNFAIDMDGFAFISMFMSIILMAAASNVSLGSMPKMFGSGIIGLGVMAIFTSIGTYLYGTAYILGWSLFGALTLGVISAIWIRGGFG